MINKHLLLLIYFVVLLSQSIFAQVNQRSEEIKWVEGEKFYIHTVAKGQGFYTIKKIYNVSEKEIIENNPEAINGLKLGQKLKIPFVKEINPEDLGYKIHTIKAGESIYSISKIYNISPEDIFKLNPETRNGYKINQELKIPLEKPKSQTDTTETELEETKNKQKTYKIKKKDTLYALAKKFGITQESLLEANPSIKQEGLRKGEKIIIPRNDIIVKEALYVPIDTLRKQDEQNINNNIACDSLIIERYTPMKVALFLPFEIDKLAFEQEEENNSSQIPQFSRKPFIEFYQGFLLAVKQLKKEGYKLNIYTFNTKKDSTEVKRILKNRIIQDLDLIIGPVYPSNFKIVQKATDSMNIPMINPIIQGTNLSKESDYTIDIFPSDAIVTQEIIQLLVQNDSSRIHFVHSGFSDDLILVSPFKRLYKKALIAAGKDT